MLSHFKDEIEVIGFDDAPFKKEDKECILIATYMRGNKIVDGVYFKKFQKDGLDVTDKMLEIIKGKHYSKIKFIFLSGITYGGFNIADINKIYFETKKPVIVCIDRYPNYNKIYSAIKKHFPDWKRRINIIESLPKPIKLDNIYIQYIGTDIPKIKELLKKTRLKSKFPECLRLSHIIGRGLLDI